jgi:hypothetical protein
MAFDQIKKIYDEQQKRITRLKFLVFQVILVTVDIGTDFYAAVKHYKYVLNFNNVHNKPSLTEHISHNVWIYSVSHQYLFMADTIFEHLKYQLDQN